MPRVPVPALFGPSNVLRSQNADSERTVNLYPELTVPGPGAKAQGLLLGTPGLVPMTEVDDAPGWRIFYQDVRCFAIIGSSFVEILQGDPFSFTVWGTVAQPSWSQLRPASIVSNGTAGDQLLIVCGGKGYVFTLSTNAFIEINNTTFPMTGFPYGNALMCEFMDGYGIVVQIDSRKFFISALDDFTLWDALDVFERSEGSDNLMGVIRNRRELWFPGTKTGEVWTNTGDADTPFQPVPGVFLETGAVTSSFTRIGNTIAWIGLDERGEGVVYIANGYEPQRISSHAVEKALQSANQLDDARLFAQQQQGHTFLWVYVPGLPTTWVYDLVTGLWHERMLWNPDSCAEEPHLLIDMAFAFNRALGVSRLDGVIYDLRMTAYDDAVVV